MSGRRETDGIAAAVGVSTAAQLASRGVHFLLNVIAGLALIRYFGPSAYGDYVFVLTYATLFGLLGDFGIGKIAVRDMAREPRDAGTALGTAIAVRLALATAAAALAQLALLVLDIRDDLRPAVAVASLLFLVDAVLSVVAVFQVRLAMHFEALVTIVIQAIDTAIILVLIQLQAGLLLLVASPVVSGIAGVAVAVILVRRRFPLALSIDRRRMRGMLMDALPIGITTMIVVLYIKTDAVILGLLATPTDVGLFGAAYKPIEYALLALMLPINVLFPLLSRWHGQERGLFRMLYWRGADALLALTLPIVVVVVVAAEPIVRTLYADSFAGAADPLRVLAMALPFMVLSAWQGFALLSGGHQRITMVYDAAALVLNVVCNLVLIPRLGYLGAAVTAVITSVFVAACAWSAAAVRLDVHGGEHMRLARVIAANGVLALTIVAGAQVAPLWLATPVALALYPVWLLVSGVVSRAELRLLSPARAGGVPAAEAR
ncbi:MAG TPA: flippase [Candidatus Limnocylindria bacterium]|nr:flippase [Candidatus Limnocylindria bacterium]